MKQMQGLDAAFVAMERADAPLHIGSVLIYDPSTAPGGFVRFKDILSFIEGRLQLAPSMRQKMVKVPFGVDYPYWVNDSSFDIEYHVRHIALPQPGDWRQLCIQAARIFARPLDMKRPPWEITVLEGLDNIPGLPKGSFAMLTKMHHAAIDGASGIELMQATHTFRPEELELSTPDTFKPESDPSQVGMFLRGSTNSLLNPFRQVNAMRKSLPGTFRAAKGLVKKEFDFKALMEAPRTRFNGVVSPHRMFGGAEFPIEDIKAMRALSEGSKLNDVMLSIVGGAMRRYLLAKEELPETSVTAMAPISVRAEQEKADMGNQVAAMFVPLGSHIASPMARMQYVHEETQKAKSFTTAMGARQMTEVSKLASAPVMNIGAALATRLKLANHVKPLINTVVTNVPGPSIPLYSSGAKLVAMYGKLCLVDGMRLGHIVNSYAGKVSLSFTADRDAMPDPDFYHQCIIESFEEHVEVLKKMQAAASPEKPKTAAVKKVKTKTVRTTQSAPDNVSELKVLKS